MHERAGPGLVAPELPALEAYGVDVLRALSQAVRVRIGKDEGRVHDGDDTATAARIAREARMSVRLEIPGPDGLPDGEGRRRRDVATGIRVRRLGRRGWDRSGFEGTSLEPCVELSCPEKVSA